MNVKERISALQNRIDELTLRERGILFLVIAAVLYMIWNAMLIAPQEQKQKRMLSDISKVRADLAQLEQQQLEIINRHKLDPNAAEQQQLDRLLASRQAVEAQIKDAVSGLIDPREMARALEGVLKSQAQLHFVRIENLGATPLLEAPAQEQQSDAANNVAIYKHTMRIELEGSFHNARNYLQALEQLPWQFHWESVELDMLKYPRARIVITVNTLSLSEGWIGV